MTYRFMFVSWIQHQRVCSFSTHFGGSRPSARMAQRQIGRSFKGLSKTASCMCIAQARHGARASRLQAHSLGFSGAPLLCIHIYKQLAHCTHVLTLLFVSVRFHWFLVDLFTLCSLSDTSIFVLVLFPSIQQIFTLCSCYSTFFSFSFFVSTDLGDFHTVLVL